MMTGLVQDQHLEKQIEKQMGCMSGFFQLFDRQQILSGKRMYSTKRLPPATGADSSPEPAKLVESPSPAPEPAKLVVVQASPDRFLPSPSTELKSPSPGNVLETPLKSPLPLPIFELKEGTRTSWKFCKEAPRLSLDSRATVDAKGSLYPREIRTNRCDSYPVSSEDRQRRSPSVIGRLMGLEPLPSNSSPDPVKKPELRRSASESRVSRDLLQSRFVDVNNFQTNNMTGNAVKENVGKGNNRTTSKYRAVDPVEYASRNVKAEPVRSSPWRSPQQRRSYFDSADFFPEPKQTTVSIFGEIERRLKIRGIDEQSTDLETLKQILEALQLKGLLHSKKPSNQTSHRNFVYDRSFAIDEYPIVLMKPWRSPAPNSRAGNDAGLRRNLNLAGESMPSVSPRRERASIDRNVRSPVRSRNSASPTRTETSPVKGSNSIVKRKTLSIQTQRRANETPEPRRVSPVQSPKLASRKSGSDQAGITNRSPRNKKPTAQINSKEKMRNNIVTEDESSSISESTVSTSSLTDTERSKIEEYREGKNLLERCDKLLHSIAEMNASELQPSPVSVLDSSFYKDESSSPSPVMKRSIDFKDSPVDLEDEIWSQAISPVKSANANDISDDADFVYISEILRATSYLTEDSDVFFLLEKQQYHKGKDTSRVSKLQRKLIFDIITEILDRNKHLPPWKAAAISWTDSGASKPSLRQIWSEFQRIRERDTADDLLELICSVLRKDLAGINGWGDQSVEMSEAVLDIERLIFKDLVSETIRDLAEFSGKSIMLAPRRKLVF